MKIHMTALKIDMTKIIGPGTGLRKNIFFKKKKKIFFTKILFKNEITQKYLINYNFPIEKKNAPAFIFQVSNLRGQTVSPKASLKMYFKNLKRMLRRHFACHLDH
jgi:hypothetical protein